VPKHHTIKTNDGVEVELHALISTLDGDSRFDRFTPGEIVPGTY